MHLSKIIKQKENEKVLMLLRRHPLVLIPSLLLFLAMHIMAILIFLYVTRLYPEMIQNDIGRAFSTFLVSILLLSAWTHMYGEFLDYYLDIWVVTDDRIINVEQHGLFGRTISEADLYKVQDVTSEIKGFFPSMFSYGSVFIQSAGEKERFVFEQVPKPHEARKMIIELVQKDRSEHAKEAMTTAM